MRVETKKVYYCEHCGRHRLRSVEKHERVCTKNPDRECGWHPGSDKLAGSAGEMRPHIEWAKSLSKVTAGILGELRLRADGCPACMLTVVRLSGHEVYAWKAVGWNYEEEVERFNKERQENEDWAAVYG